MSPELLNRCFKKFLGREAQEHEVRHFSSKYSGEDGVIDFIEQLLSCEEYTRRFSGDREFVPGGHFYSVVPSTDDIKRALARHSQICQLGTIPGVERNVEAWRSHLESIVRHAAEAPFPEDKQTEFRYYYQNPAYGHGDALSLFAMLLDLKPRKIIEIGSGYSSALILDTVERYLDGQTQITFVEPYPQLLRSLMKDFDKSRCDVIESGVQQVDLALFESLESGDILFIDSTHVAKLGSDVNFLFFEVLPRLAKGVRIHVHDIFWPFEYPARWIEERRAWNEAYMLRALLSDSRRYSIVYFSGYMHQFERSWLEQHASVILKNPGGHLWMEVT